jgi:diguanylate cyclase (GGDEF)-like protein
MLRHESGAIDRVLARALPHELAEDDLRARPRALLLLRFTLMGALFTFALSGYFAWYLDSSFTGLMNLLYTATLVITPFVLRRTGSVEFASHWALTSAFAVLAVECWVLGGVASRAYYWLAVLPVGGMLLCGTRGGAIWCALSTSAVAALGVAHFLGWIPNAMPMDSGVLAETVVSAGSLSIALSGLSWLSETRAMALLNHIEGERTMFRERSVTDPLTGLANRSLVLECLNRSHARCRRHGLRGTFLFIDLVDFKRVNDDMGHATGDAVLREVAERLSGVLRRSDLAGRLGGDEFALIVEGLKTRAGATTLAEKVGARLIAPYDVGGIPVRIGASIGITFYPEETDSEYPQASDLDIQEIMKRADTAMYRAKRSGQLFAIE